MLAAGANRDAGLARSGGSMRLLDGRCFVHRLARRGAKSRRWRQSRQSSSAKLHRWGGWLGMLVGSSGGFSIGIGGNDGKRGNSGGIGAGDRVQ